MTPNPSTTPSPWLPAGHPGAPPSQPLLDLQSLDGEQALGLMRLLEGAPSVQRRHQFFVWTQSQMQPLVPHQLLVCGAWQRQRRAVVLDAFHSVVLPAPAIEHLTDANGPLVAALAAHWVEGRGRARALPLSQLSGSARLAAEPLQAVLGDSHLLVHGVARPQRPTEIESLFVIGGLGGLGAPGLTLAQRCGWLDVVLPFLHSTWLRVTATELDLQRPGGPGSPAAPDKARTAAASAPRGSVTERERQILSWVQEGKSNHQIATVLGISPLTVKNHVQKILRKLGASNRAQAVSRAMALGALPPPERRHEADEG
ncbi:LuxR C-terminal-related transcriptional regulator [Aquabacterium sp. OR-4]|uniref:LuxR C-terminal-related transcriptional regulator n=1 Tax=Aquabacterium sp. OR-4 TaxID=2978127 RepID=UPI0028C753BF|nr:LuxR C-terminal-related transcriptional regulator [Aquabacterium sp. OR-4]MDT7838943.1 LuxR C-terminal-related transcriptional regulator [Aquabacterium sp. OR-4]